MHPNGLNFGKWNWKGVVSFIYGGLKWKTTVGCCVEMKRVSGCGEATFKLEGNFLSGGVCTEVK